MQNTSYAGYPATSGYYSNQPPPPPQSSSASAANPVPAYGSGTANPYGGSYPPPPPAAAASSDQYPSYAAANPPAYDAKNPPQQAYLGYAQGTGANPPPPPNAATTVPAQPPATGAAYGTTTAVTDSYGNNPYGYSNQPGTVPVPGTVANPTQAPPPPVYSSQYGPNASQPGPNGQWPAGGPQQPVAPGGPPPPSNYGTGPNGYGSYNHANNMNRPNAMTQQQPPMAPGNFRGGPMTGRNAGNVPAGGYKGGAPPSSAHNPGGYMPPVADIDNDTIFISGMPTDVNESQLASHFGSIGIIKMDRAQKHKIWIYRDKVTGEGKGEATLTYEDPHTAKSAIQWFHGKELPGTGKILNVEFAQRKTPAGGDFKGRRGGGGGGPMRSGDRGGRDGGGRGGHRNRDNGFVRQGDWRCPGCSNNNFSWREQCNRCKAPRPDDIGPPEGGERGGDHRRSMDRRGGPPMNRRDGPPMGGGHGGMRGPPMGDRDRPPMRGDRGPPMRGGRGGPPRGGRGDFGPMRGPPMNDRRPKPY